MVSCLLMAHFSCRDETTFCLNCSRKLACAFHRTQFECRVLFTWNMVTGDWNVVDFGELYDAEPPIHKQVVLGSGNGNRAQQRLLLPTLAERAKRLAKELHCSLENLPDYTSNLRILDSCLKRSKRFITDMDNLLEFHLKRPRTTSDDDYSRVSLSQ